MFLFIFLVYLDLRLMLDFGEDWAGLLRLRDGVGSAFLLFKDGLSYMFKFIRANCMAATRYSFHDARVS